MQFPAFGAELFVKATPRKFVTGQLHHQNCAVLR
jgi:hypothetical protein